MKMIGQFHAPTAWTPDPVLIEQESVWEQEVNYVVEKGEIIAYARDRTTIPRLSSL
jgi:hypothetical protein